MNPVIILTEHNKRPMIKTKANMFFKENAMNQIWKIERKLIS